METTLTAKLKLTRSPDQFRALRATQLAYRDALHRVSAYSFAPGKTSNHRRWHRETYRDIRPQFGLPAQRAGTVPRQVGSTYQALWTRARKHAAARRLGSTTRRFTGLDDAPHSVSPTLFYTRGRDYSLSSGHEVSILTRSGRIPLPYQGSSKQVALLQAGAIIGGAKLWYDRSTQHFSRLVALTVEPPDPTPQSQQQISGVDVGRRSLATVATLGTGAQFYSGKAVRAKADHSARLQKRLQRKGTRSATRRRISIGQRERRVKLTTTPTISTHLLDPHAKSVIGLEAVNGSRDRTKRQPGTTATKQPRRANRHASKWACAEVQGMLASKAVRAGSLCRQLDADSTSQACPTCGLTSKEHRPKKGLLFVCQNCHSTLHAD